MGAESCVRRFMADLVIGHFQDIAAAVLLAHIMAEREGTSLPILEQVKPPLVTELRPPVLSNNWGNLTETCMLDDTFRALVRPLVVSFRAPKTPGCKLASWHVMCVVVRSQAYGNVWLWVQKPVVRAEINWYKCNSVRAPNRL